jgi:hypothetical protein
MRDDTNAEFSRQHGSLDNHQIPLYYDLKKQHEKGELNIPDDTWFWMHLSEVRKKMGSKYAMFMNGKELRAWIQFDRL